MATIGGIALIIGAFFVYKGKIFYSMFMYFIGDLVWISLAFKSGDILGAILVIIGTCLGVLAYLKMNNGSMRKNLEW